MRIKQDSDSGIYQITNLLNGNFYVGSSNFIFRRWAKHKIDLKNNRHHSKHLQNAWNKYGEDIFEFKVLEYIKGIIQLIEREQYYLDNLKPVYNTNLYAYSAKGYKHTEEAKAKMRNHYSLLSNNQKAKRKEQIGKFHKGRKRSEITKYRMSISRKRQINIIRDNGLRKKCYQFDAKNKTLLKEWDSISLAARETNSSRSNIISHCNNKRLNTNGLYIWSLKNKL